MNKLVRDGKVAVLVSPGFGAGWYTWNSEYPCLLFDSQLVEAVEKEDKDALKKRVNEIAPGTYLGGMDQLRIRWLPEGTQFQVTEYDGSEGLKIADEQKWITA
jgi:hypothetical protein